MYPFELFEKSFMLCVTMYVH